MKGATKMWKCLMNDVFKLYIYICNPCGLEVYQGYLVLTVA